MSLAEICGLQDFDTFKSRDVYKNDLDSLCTNFDHNMQLGVPPFSNPAENLARFTKDEMGKEIKIKFDHGTTTLGFKYQGGIVLAVDSRATGGQFIGSQTMKKIVEINKYLLGTLAGGAADCVYWDRVLAKQCRMYELRNRERISVAAASN
nr:unnamed protein product [Callosobruchus analis]